MRALVSAYDKTGIVELATELAGLGWQIVSSGGTAAALRDAGVEVVAVEDVTASPEMLDGRVKTLHPRIHGGILADRSKPAHMDALAEHGIDAIDLVVCNLYPFRSDPGVELIDIGGPAMVRAAAKNHGDESGGVGVLVDPADYAAVLDELRADGRLGLGTRRRLARTAFAHTAAYDAAIVAWLDAREPGALPATIHLALERAQECRYGENPHQRGARYRPAGESAWWDHAVQHGGPALSYLNYFDAAAAWHIAHDLGTAAGGAAAAVIVKHANPCGAAVGSVGAGGAGPAGVGAPPVDAGLADAYQRAYDCDPRSAFGGIVALNRVVDEATVERIEAAAQADLIIAPGFDQGVVERIAARRRNTRVLEAPAPDSAAGAVAGTAAAVALRQIDGGWLAQSPAVFAADPAAWKAVTQRRPTDDELADAAFAWRVCGHVSSNAVVLARGGTAWGIGAGQQNRVESAQLAAAKAAGRAAGGACASDAFYPFPDGVEAAAEAGVAVVVQPGGAMRDDDVIAAADRLGLAMLFTGERQFKH
ncbi:MAG TPA: bifunctional phosphoribosylaminoimidazolecarboxamide formyltransferase/IMP cyclohydrolase PurH [Acidimicrobiaceae bacterium]|nr:bifunctional phosphoribosylaminoimidazolecarboxamide formyltransferase/IMP cyclohydrolase PurH [Acidimicrobiaceae bacterium]HCB37452.1 bifunctional phosphoribosylaminoimidazolecarboxamide formyltransferase/IMP cyclohydrolase PurH [Acidimicrobiaceae bacterium]